MAVKAVSVSEAISSIGLKALIYGPAGSGKTTLAKTMPKPVLVIDFEGGIITLMGEPDILVCPVRSTEELRAVVSELLKDTEFKSVVFDGLSIYIRRRTQEIRGEKERATWDDWQKLTNEVRSAVFPLLQVRKHLLLTSLPKYIRERDERGREVGPIVGAAPNLTPAIMNELVAACDLVGYLVAPNDPLFPNADGRTVLFAPVNGLKITTKSRVFNLSQAEPDFTKWLEFVGAPELIPTAVSIPQKPTIAEDAQQPKQVQSQQPQPAGQPETELSESTGSDDLTKEIFRLAKELQMDNKALGRLARQYFGESYIRNLSDQQKHKLIAVMKKMKESKSNQQDGGSEVLQFINSWREFRGSDDLIPFESEFAEIAVKHGWMPDELEAAISEQLLELKFDFAALPEDRYWLSAVPQEILEEALKRLAGGVS